MTSGAPRPTPWRAFAGLVAFVFAACTVNAFTVIDDVGHGPAWKPFVFEWSSALTTIVFLPVVWRLSLFATGGRGRWLRFSIVHLAGAAAYCLFHVSGFIVLRKLAFANMGQMYDFGSWDRLFYEFRKDAVAYAGFLAVFLLSARLGRQAQAAVEPTLDEASDAVFDIRDGAKLVRTPVTRILCATSAGNYVEFQLADGRKPLMRATLASVEAALAPHGFVRTHRSWIVNGKQVRGLTAEGSGDWSVELEGGVEAPLSRRFPEALEALKRPA